MKLIEALEEAVAPGEIVRRREQTRLGLLERSPYVSAPQFTKLHPEDLRLLFDLCDAAWFQGGLRSALNGRALHFRISTRATSRAGSMHARRLHGPFGSVVEFFEMTVSATLLFGSFGDGQRTVLSGGRECADRLDALQRVMEHEIVHLAEQLVWGASSCSGPRFQGIAQRQFDHLEHTHELLTPRERVEADLGIRVGDRVAFQFEAERLEGRVNRITKRATVLVEAPDGLPFSNGKRYFAYYVPPRLLERL